MHASQTVLITGANGGLGMAVTRAFLDGGYTVFGAAREIAASDFSHSSFHPRPGNIQTGAEAHALVQGILSETGRLDALIHLVGGYAGGQTVDETDDATLDRMMDLNFRTAFHLFRAVLPSMRSQRRGAIIAIGSRTAVDPQPMLAAYSASKAALISLVRTIAVEAKAEGVSANVVLPGTMDTPANRAANPGADPARWVQPRQVASLLLHLASPHASQVSGATIPIYGGDL